jgi:hypothetical protein
MKMLQGYIAGNPMTDKKFDTDGKIKFFHGMGLISDELYEVMKIITQFLYSFIYFSQAVILATLQEASCILAPNKRKKKSFLLFKSEG